MMTASSCSFDFFDLSSMAGHRFGLYCVAEE
jgi:hypothetical protein